MSLVTLTPNDPKTRVTIMAAVAAGTAVIWAFKSGLYFGWYGTSMQTSTSPLDLTSVANGSQPTSGYQIVASSCGMAATLPTPPNGPGVPSTSTVSANYGGFGLRAMDADDFAAAYWGASETL